MKTGIYWQDPKYAVGQCRTDPSCVLHLPLHRLDGASFVSKDTYGHLCTVTGALWTPKGRSFDGSDDYINCGNDESLDLLSAITIELWLKAPYPTSDSVIIAKDAVGQRAWTFLLQATGKLRAFVYQIGVGSSTGVVGNDVWTHIALVVVSGTSLIFYINGEASGVFTTLPDIISTTSEVWVGARSYAGSPLYLEGLIDEVGIYNRAMTPLEIQHNYLASKWRYQ